MAVIDPWTFLRANIPSHDLYVKGEVAFQTISSREKRAFLCFTLKVGGQDFDIIGTLIFWLCHWIQMGVLSYFY